MNRYLFYLITNYSELSGESIVSEHFEFLSHFVFKRHPLFFLSEEFKVRLSGKGFDYFTHTHHELFHSVEGEEAREGRRRGGSVVMREEMEMERN
jgi:hypothetical protein